MDNTMTLGGQKHETVTIVVSFGNGWTSLHPRQNSGRFVQTGLVLDDNRRFFRVDFSFFFNFSRKRSRANMWSMKCSENSTSIPWTPSEMRKPLEKVKGIISTDQALYTGVISHRKRPLRNFHCRLYISIISRKTAGSVPTGRWLFDIPGVHSLFIVWVLHLFTVALFTQDRHRFFVFMA